MQTALRRLPCSGSTSISVLVKDGGNKLLQIQDNGHGINVRPSLLLRRILDYRFAAS